LAEIGSILNTVALRIDKTKPPIPKYPKESTECKNGRSGFGGFFWSPMKNLNETGCMVKDRITAKKMPMMETTDMEYKAGCFAKIREPTPNIVVSIESKIEVL